MILFPAILENITSRKDRTWKITLGTNELTPDQVLGLSGYLNKFCFAALKSDEFKSKEIETVENLKSDFEDTGKSPAQRLRNVLFILYKQDQEGYTMFDDYYKHKMEGFIEHLKGKIL